ADRLWLICNACQRSYLVMHDEFVAFHGLDPATAFPTVNKRMRCVACGEKKGQWRPERHGSEKQKAYPIVGAPLEGPQPTRRILQPSYEPRRASWPEISDDEQIEF